MGNLLILLLLFAILELALRVSGRMPYHLDANRPNIKVNPDNRYFQPDTLLGYRHLPGKFEVLLKDEFVFTTTHDENTLRITRPVQDTSKMNLPEIWFLGCSVTHGWSVNDEATFAWLLQSKLEQFSILNWGVSGYGTLHFYLQLKEMLKRKAAPHTVVLFHADFHEERNTFTYHRKRQVVRWNFLGKLMQPEARFDQNDSLHIRQVNEVEYEVWTISKYSALMYRVERMVENILDGFDQKALVTQALLERIYQTCQAAKIKLVIVNLNGDAGHYLNDFCEQKKIPLVDIALDISEPANNNQPYDGHPSAKAHHKYAEGLWRFFETWE